MERLSWPINRGLMLLIFVISREEAAGMGSCLVHLLKGLVMNPSVKSRNQQEERSLEQNDLFSRVKQQLMQMLILTYWGMWEKILIQRLWECHRL